MMMMSSCSARDRLVSIRVKLGMKQKIEPGLSTVGKKDHHHEIMHRNFRRKYRKQFSTKYTMPAKIDDSKATTPGHSPGIGHG